MTSNPAWYEGQSVVINCDAWTKRSSKSGFIRTITDDFVFVDSDDLQQVSVAFTHDGSCVKRPGSIEPAYPDPAEATG